MSWSQNDVDTLKAMWAEGSSCSVIARALGGGITRNAVIGKVTRLGLPPRAVMTRQAPAARAPRATSPTTRRVFKPMAEAPAPKQRDDGTAVTLLNARRSECRWPVGDVSGEMPLCGCETEPGESWCAFHQTKVYQAGEAARINALSLKRKIESDLARRAERVAR